MTTGRNTAPPPSPARRDVPTAPEAAVFLGGSANRGLTRLVERALGVRFLAATSERFPDGEVFARLDESVRGCDVVVLQPTAPPVNDHLVELLAIVDACRRAAARRIVAIVPYFGYARSDRRNGRRAPIMGRLVADLMERAGVDHVITLDVHTPALEGFFRVPVDNLTAVPLLADALRPHMTKDSVIVSPDAGAARLAARYATALGMPVAICEKHRVSGADVVVRRVTGDVAGRPCVIVDDMISTGGTIVEAIRAVRAAGAADSALVVATHGVFVPGARARLDAVGIREIIVTDSIALPPDDPGFTTRVAVVSIGRLIATAIGELLAGRSLSTIT